MADILRIKRRTTGVAGAPSALANAELAFHNETGRPCLYHGEGTAARAEALAGLSASPGKAGGPRQLMNGAAAAGTATTWSPGSRPPEPTTSPGPGPARRLGVHGKPPTAPTPATAGLLPLCSPPRPS